MEIGKKYVFYGILDRKNRFRRQQEEEVKNFKENSILAKGLVHGFDQKSTILPSFFILGKIGQHKMFHDILE